MDTAHGTLFTKVHEPHMSSPQSVFFSPQHTVLLATSGAVTRGAVHVGHWALRNAQYSGPRNPMMAKVRCSLPQEASICRAEQRIRLLVTC